jgi:probable rRNA maturation factor
VDRHYRPPWRIDLEIRPGVVRLLPSTALVAAVTSALRAADAPGPASIGLILSDDRELAELNAAHLGQVGPTDVLSFPLLPSDAYPSHVGSAAAAVANPGAPEGFVLPPARRAHLGDIVVSVERAVAQAAGGRGGQTGDIRWSAADELRLLVTHGTLHICGWDHADPIEEAAMRALERRLLAVP